MEVLVMRKITVCSLLAFLLITVWGGVSSQASQEEMPAYRISHVLQQQIVNPKGTLLGIVQDVVFDGEGKITYLVLSRGSAFGNIGPLLPIPWKDAKMEQRGKNFVFVVDVELNSLDGAPGIRTKEWPATFSADFIHQVEQFYEHR